MSDPTENPMTINDVHKRETPEPNPEKTIDEEIQETTDSIIALMASMQDDIAYLRELVAEL